MTVEETSTGTANYELIAFIRLPFKPNITRIMSQLRDVNTICRRSWYIAAHVWKMYDFKIEVVPFIINFSTELTTVVKFEV
jgi:hypothetical protein